MAKIGVDSLVYAIMKTEGTRSTKPTWDTPKEAPGVISININANSSQETLFADNGPFESAAALGAIDVEIQKAALSTENKADLLGHMIDSNGGLVYSGSDIPPNVAIGFRSLKSNGKYRYVWLFQGKFTEPEDNSETKGDAVNFQTETITGQFAEIATELNIKGAELEATSGPKRPWKYEIDEEAAGAAAAIIKAWFEAVTLPPEAVPGV